MLFIHHCVDSKHSNACFLIQLSFPYSLSFFFPQQLPHTCEQLRLFVFLIFSEQDLFKLLLHLHPAEIRAHFIRHAGEPV